MFYGYNDRFNALLLSADYAQKGSFQRFNELGRAFPNTLIVFEHGGLYYGFEESAVMLYYLFGCQYYLKKDMLVAKIEKAKFEPFLIEQRQLDGLRCVIDRDGSLTFENNKRTFSLQKTLAYYKTNMGRFQKGKTSSTRTHSESKRSGGGWHDDVWAPGLPSTRFFRKKNGNKSPKS